MGQLYHSRDDDIAKFQLNNTGQVMFTVVCASSDSPYDKTSEGFVAWIIRRNGRILPELQLNVKWLKCCIF